VTVIGERLSIEEINRRFEGQWVLLEDPEIAEDEEVLSGRLLFHTEDRDELDERVLDLRPRHSAIFFVGEPDPELAYLL
jgi:hypothetical protein